MQETDSVHTLPHHLRNVVLTAYPRRPSFSRLPRYNQGRQKWTSVWGEDSVSSCPPHVHPLWKGRVRRLPISSPCSVIKFHHQSWKSRARHIVSLTQQHALSLASFVSLYKTLLLLQKRLNGGKERKADTFFAGLIGGYIIFGDRTPINEQASVCS